MTAPAGLLERIGGRLFPSPAPVDGLITEEDIANARRQGLLGLGAGLLAASGPSTQRTTFTQAVGQGLQAGQQAQQGALDTSMQRRMVGLQAGGLQRDARRQEAVAAARQQIVAQNPMPQDAPSMAAWIDKVYPLFVQAGDEEMVSRLTQIRSSIGQQNAARAPQEIRLGDKVILRDPVTGQTVGEYPIAPSPRDPNAPDTAQQLRDQRSFAREQQLGDDFNKDTTTQRQTARKLAGAIGEGANAAAGDGASQVNILYAFVNAMDPQSAVREGEIGLARAAAPIWSQANALLSKYMNNESVIVPPALVNQMVDLMRRRYTGLQGQVQERVDYYRRRGRRWGVDPETFTGIDDLSGGAVQQRQPGETVEAYLARTGQR